MNLPLSEHSMLFAPMEGITDSYYREMAMGLYPEWDRFSCDFLRAPTPAPYPEKHIIKHFGDNIYQNPKLKNKTQYQILTSPNAHTTETVQSIAKLGFEWLDLNLGCPSKTVCKNQGGSFLLSELDKLRIIIKTIRSNFKNTFTCKIRVGYEDDTNFENILKLLEDEGVDAITIHARTRVELYKGVANWDYVKDAVKMVNIPVIGNGDIWTLEDIEKYFDYTQCHSIMLARSALKTPWLATLYKNKQEDTLSFRASEIHRYFHQFYETVSSQPNLEENSRIKRLKSVSRYIFDDFPHAAIFKKRFLLSKTFEEQQDCLEDLKRTYH